MVVDASVAVKSGVAEPGHDAAIMIVASGEEQVSPTVLVAEAANVFRKKAKRGEMSWPQAFEAMSGIRSAIGRFVDVTPWADRILSLCRDLDHPAYDCCYLVCSRELGVPLVTTDTILAAKGRQAGLQCVMLSDWQADHSTSSQT
jgi:predicted nucleic acid-binding protein